MSTDLMTTEQQRAKEQAAVMLAFAEGKRVDVRDLRFETWKALEANNTSPFNWYWFDYRIAPDQEPCATPEMLEKLPGGADKWERVREGLAKPEDWGIWVGDVQCERVQRLIPGYLISFLESNPRPIHVYRRKPEPQLPPIPYGYELVPSDSQDIPEIGWKYSRAGNASWKNQAEGCDRSCQFWSSMDLRFIRPIRKPKMPDGIFVVRLSSGTHISVHAYYQNTLVLSGGSKAFTLQELIDSGAEWSHDRKTWYDFTGKLMK